MIWYDVRTFIYLLTLYIWNLIIFLPCINPAFSIFKVLWLLMWKCTLDNVFDLCQIWVRKKKYTYIFIKTGVLVQHEGHFLSPWRQHQLWYWSPCADSSCFSWLSSVIDLFYRQPGEGDRGTEQVPRYLKTDKLFMRSIFKSSHKWKRWITYSYFFLLM